MNRKALFAIAFATILGAGCSSQTQPTSSLPAQNKLDIKVAGVERVKQWKASQGGSVTLTKGVALKSINGSLSGFESDPGYEIAVVKLSVQRADNTAPQTVSEVKAVDDKGTEFLSLVGDPFPLGKEKTENREFAFAVPTGTQLKKIQLAKDLSLDLK
jgi:hypothetical protein